MLKIPNSEFLLRFAYSRFCRRQFQNPDCFSRKFSHLRWVSGNVPMGAVLRASAFFHLPVMPNRFITRMISPDR
jgi:hypothetical protein